MLRINKEMKKKILRRKRKIKREEETKINSSRKTSTPRKTVPHQTRMMIVTVIQKEYFSCQYKMMKKILKKKVKSISEKN
jgi:hypothetical protein